MGRTEGKESRQIREALLNGGTYHDLKSKGYNRRLIYTVAERLRKEGHDLVQKPNPTKNRHLDVRTALLEGKGYDEIEKMTGKPRRTIYGIAHRMREAGVQLKCGYMGETKTREQKILADGTLGSVTKILHGVDDQTFDELINQRGRDWSEKIIEMLKKKTR